MNFMKLVEITPLMSQSMSDIEKEVF
jgi:hypothetical protein